MEEVWRDIEGYEGYYQVSNLGRVRSVDRIVYSKAGWSRLQRGRMMKSSNTGVGYKSDNAYQFVGLCRDNIVVAYFVHRLVAFAFPEICGEWFDGAEINHKNELKYDNRAENLEWVNHLTNLTYNGRNRKVGEKLKGRAPFNRKCVVMFKDGSKVQEFNSVVSAGEWLGVSECTIRDCIYGIRNQVRGYSFEYKYENGRYSEERLTEHKRRDNEYHKQRRKNNGNKVQEPQG